MAGKLNNAKVVRQEAISAMMANGYYDTDEIIAGLRLARVPVPGRQTVLKDISDIFKVWKERRTLAMDQRISFEIGMVEKIRTKALEAYDRSTEGITTTEVNSETEGLQMPAAATGGTELDLGIARLLQGGGLGSGKTVRKHKVVSSSGDPRFLDTALNASKEIRTILGVDPVTVKRVELITREGPAISAEELREMDPTALAKLIGDEIAGASGP